MATGAWRSARMEDASLLVEWERQFLIECGFPLPAALLTDVVIPRLETLGMLYWIWEIDNAPVAMALGRLAPPTARIEPVYTVPAFRSRGCAGALVGHLSNALMGAGARTFSLFTDLANLVSNGVYRRLGFRCIGELVHVDLEALN